MRSETLAGLDLAQYIRPGDGVLLQQGCGEALSLGEKLVEQRAAYSGAGVFFGSGFSRTFQPEHAAAGQCEVSVNRQSARGRSRKHETCTRDVSDNRSRAAQYAGRLNR